MIRLIKSKQYLLRQPGAVIVLLLVVSAMGPYIPGALGLRLEHIVIYGFSCLFISRWLLRSRTAERRIRAITVLMILVIIWTMLSTIISGRILTGEVIAGIENYLQPVALLVILSVLLQSRGVDPKKLFVFSALSSCLVLSLNSVIALLTVFFDISSWIQYFTGDVSSYQELSVWKNSVALGRYPGIFNQPFESGLAHSLGLFAWVYLFADYSKSRFLYSFLFLGVCIGGFLSISKVFLFIGLPLAGFYWLWSGVNQKKLWLMVSAPFFLWGAGCLLMPHWDGLDRLLGYMNMSSLDNGQSYVSYYSSGRLDKNESGVFPLFIKAWQEAPFWGFGFGAWEGPLDNAYIEFFYQGGLIGLLVYILILFLILLLAIRGLRHKVSEGKFVLIVFLLIITAGIGAPVLTINRGSIFLWVLLVLAMYMCEPGNKGSRDSAGVQNTSDKYGRRVTE